MAYYNSFQNFCKNITGIQTTSSHHRCLVSAVGLNTRNLPHKSRQVSTLDTREAIFTSNSNKVDTNTNSADYPPIPLQNTTIHSRNVRYSRCQIDLIQNDTAAHTSSNIVIPSFPSNTFIDASKYGTHQASLRVSPPV